LLLSCCCLSGIGGFWFFFLGSDKVEEQVVGIWQVDVVATKAANKARWHIVPDNLALEFNKDHTCRVTMRNEEILKGTWRVVARKDKSVTIELKLDSAPQPVPMKLTARDKDHLSLTESTAVADCEVVRVSAFPQPPSYENVPVLKPRAQFQPGWGKAGTEEAIVARLFLAADGSRLAVSSLPGLGGKGRLQVWDVSGNPKRVYDGDGEVLALAPDGKRLLRRLLAVAEEIVDVDSGAAVTADVSAIHGFFQGADVLVVAGFNADAKQGGLAVSVLDAATGKKTAALGPVGELDAQLVAVNGGGDLYVGASKPDRVRVFNVAAGKVVREITPAVEAPFRVEWYLFTASADGKYFAANVVGGDTPVPTIFSAATGAKVADLPRGVGLPEGFVPGRELVLVPGVITRPGRKGGVDLVAYDFSKKTVVAACRANDKAFTNMAVSSNGRVLAAATVDGDVFVWDLAQLK
jgi:hypothetical protein